MTRMDKARLGVAVAASAMAFAYFASNGRPVAAGGVLLLSAAALYAAGRRS